MKVTFKKKRISFGYDLAESFFLPRLLRKEKFKWKGEKFVLG